MGNFEFLNIELCEDDIQELDSNIISYKKQVNKLVSESRKLAKGEKCIYCGKEVSSFCNSHTIPEFSLKCIATKGELYYSNTLINFPLMDIDKGVSKAGTFQVLCRNCDSKVFKDYENPLNYDTEPTSQMIAQIAMKNYLQAISKRLHEYALYDLVGNIYPEIQDGINYMHSIQDLDLQEYRKGFEKAKRLSTKSWEGEYYIFYYEKLNYVVPIAFQGAVALIADLDGKIINDLYSKNPNYRIEDLHICVLPLKDSSIIMMFIDSKNKKYRNFYKKFRKLPTEKKLAITNYIIFLYSEDIFFSKEIPDDVLKNPYLIEIAKRTTIGIGLNPLIDINSYAKESFDLSKVDNVPNLLTEKYKLR